MNRQTTDEYRRHRIDVRDWRRRGMIPFLAESTECTYTRRDRRIGYEIIQLNWTSCALGGRRPWFLCPKCETRVAILYHAADLACRDCYDLAYRSRLEPDFERSVRQIDKLRDRLQWPPGFGYGAFGRPKGMHMKTYRQLLTDYGRREATVLDGYDAKIGSLSMALRQPLSVPGP